MSSPTIRDVARLAGVGIGTVSRVLNNHQSVSPTTQERVLSAIKTLDYKPNHVARQLQQQVRLKNIGVVTQPFSNYHSYAERLRGVQAALTNHENTYELILYNVSSMARFNERIASIARTGGIEGLLVIDLPLTNDHCAMLEQNGTPFVGLNNYPNMNWKVIGSDDLQGGYLATKHLLDLGHTRIAYVGDTFQNEYGFCTSTERHKGYSKALNEYGVKVDPALIRLGEYGFDSAKTLTTELLPHNPTAIFAMSDIQALGCIAAIKEAGLRVPDDISVIGYDDLELSYHSGLSTVRQHLDESGRVAMEYMLHMIEGGALHPVPKVPPLQVIPRQTTRRLPGSELSSASSI